MYIDYELFESRVSIMASMISDNASGIFGLGACDLPLRKYRTGCEGGVPYTDAETDMAGACKQYRQPRQEAADDDRASDGGKVMDRTGNEKLIAQLMADDCHLRRAMKMAATPPMELMFLAYREKCC